MLFIMLMAIAVLLFMTLDWLWFKWALGPHMDKFWSVMAFISVAAGKTFADVAQEVWITNGRYPFRSSCVSSQLPSSLSALGKK